MPWQIETAAHELNPDHDFGRFTLSLSPYGYERLKQDVIPAGRTVFSFDSDGPCVPMTEIDTMQLETGVFSIVVEPQQSELFIVTPRTE